MIKKLLPLLVLSTISATTVAATPPNTLVVARGLDDIVSPTRQKLMNSQVFRLYQVCINA